MISVLLVSFGLGYFMADVFRGFQAKSQPEKPVVQVCGRGFIVGIDGKFLHLGDGRFIAPQRHRLVDFADLFPRRGMVVAFGVGIDEIPEQNDLILGVVNGGDPFEDGSVFFVGVPERDFGEFSFGDVVGHPVEADGLPLFIVE